MRVGKIVIHTVGLAALAAGWLSLAAPAAAQSTLSVSERLAAYRERVARLEDQAAIENLTGSETFGDALTGDGNINVIEGRGGGDVIEGGGGNDVLDGGTGTDDRFRAVTAGRSLSAINAGGLPASRVRSVPGQCPACQ